MLANALSALQARNLPQALERNALRSSLLASVFLSVQWFGLDFVD